MIDAPELTADAGSGITRAHVNYVLAVINPGRTEAMAGMTLREYMREGRFATVTEGYIGETGKAANELAQTYTQYHPQPPISHGGVVADGRTRGSLINQAIREVACLGVDAPFRSHGLFVHALGQTPPPGMEDLGAIILTAERTQSLRSPARSR